MGELDAHDISQRLFSQDNKITCEIHALTALTALLADAIMR